MRRVFGNLNDMVWICLEVAKSCGNAVAAIAAAATAITTYLGFRGLIASHKTAVDSRNVPGIILNILIAEELILSEGGIPSMRRVFGNLNDMVWICLEHAEVDDEKKFIMTTAHIRHGTAGGRGRRLPGRQGYGRIASEPQLA